MRKRFFLGILLLNIILITGCGLKNHTSASSDLQENAKESTEGNALPEENVSTKEPETMSFSVKTVEIIVSANDREIYVKGYVPDDESKHPAVLLSHGYNGSSSDFTNECKYYAENGFAAYALDFCGGSVRSKSSGASTEMTIFTEKEDLLAAFEHISALENVDSENIYLFGGSQGGLVTALVAEEISDKIKGIAMYFPALCIPDNWRNNYKTEKEIPEVTDFWGLKLGKVFFTSIRDFYTFENIGSFSKKVLIIQGDKDPIVPLSYVEQAAKLYTNAELVILEGEAHGFSPAGAKTAMEKVLQFMQE